MLYVNPISSLEPATSATSATSNAAKEKRALEELEHFFLFTLLQEMRKSIPQDGLFKGGAERGIYEEMMDDALSGAMAKTGQFGIAKTIEAQLRAADAQHAPASNMKIETSPAVK